MSSTLHFLLLLLTLLFSSPLLLSSTPIIPTHNRRTLHQPFFPLLAFPSPPPQPTTAPPFPKDPSPLPSNHRPFFPVYPSPPPPKPSLPSLPTNLSSLSVPPHSSSRNLLPLVALPATVLLVLVVVLAFLLLHRRRIRRRSTEDDDAGSDSHRLFPPSSTAPDARKLSASSTPPGSEFLYLGTLVNSRGRVDEASTASASTCSPYRKLGSPELRPLPPLPPQVRHADGGCSSEEEFYSPSGGSPGEKGSPGGLAGRLASSSQKSFTAAALGKCASPISTLSSPSYPSSTLVSSPSPSSSPAISSSPGRSTIRSPSSRVTGFWPPPPPDPPRLLRRLTPSPPKRKPLSPSLHSSPPEKDSDRNSRISDTSGQNLHSSETIGDSSRNPFAAIPPPRRTPPPPPPPPSGYWEPRVPKMSGQPPVLLPPRPIGLKNSAAAVFPAEAPEDSNAVQKSEDKRRPKLKPLHWDKVRASSDRAMVWDQLKSSSFELNEEMIETLFICEATNAGTKGRTRQQDSLSSNQENRVLDPKKSQNIAILLRALNVTQEEVCEALLEGNTDSLDNELLETLLKMAPTKEEEFRLKEYKDDSPFKLGPAEKFLKAVLGVPFAFKRLDAMLYIANFESEISYLRKSFETLEAACEELRSSRLFFKLLEAVLKTGNRMNVGTNRGDAQAFKLDTLLKLVDVKGADGNTTLLHFVVQEIIKAEGARFFAANPSTAETHVAASRDDLEYKKLGLRVVSGLGSELHNVTKAAGMDSDVLSSYVSKLAGGIGKIGEVLRLNNRQSQQFHDSMIGFLKTAEDEVIKLQAQQSVAMSLVKEITGFFHGGSAKEEAHPFRIFMVVRDLLAVLDRVCKEVGRINERASTVSTVHCVPMPVNPILPPVFPRLHTSRPGSSDDEGSS